MIFDINDLKFSSEERTILSVQKLSVIQNQHLLLLGPSGCGKTTLMNIMAGLLKPSAGEITFNGQSYSALSGHDLDRLRAKNFGFVFQQLHLIGHLSASQNISLAQSKHDEKRVQELIDDLDLSAVAGQKAHDLSVGEAQRVAIARAVANNPQVIFADEPTSALDDTNTDRVMDLIFEQAQKTNATVIAATHDARIKERFDTVLEMAA